MIANNNLFRHPSLQLLLQAFFCPGEMRLAVINFERIYSSLTSDTWHKISRLQLVIMAVSVAVSYYGIISNTYKVRRLL